MKPLVLALVASICLGALAQEARIPLVQPRPSTLILERVTPINQHHAEFKGAIWVSGTLYATWSQPSSSPVELRLVPDGASRKRLPHFARYGVTWIEVKNGSEALKMSFSASEYKRVLAREGSMAHVTGAWQISGYAVGIECDAPYAYATIIKTKIPGHKLAGIKRPETC